MGPLSPWLSMVLAVVACAVLGAPRHAGAAHLRQHADTWHLGGGRGGGGGGGGGAHALQPREDLAAKFGFSGRAGMPDDLAQVVAAASQSPAAALGGGRTGGGSPTSAAETLAFDVNVRRHIGNLNVMTFNLRSALHRNDTGIRDWEVRKVLIAAMLGIYRPHVLAVQEGTPEMLAYLASAVPGYVVAPHLAEHGHLEGNTNGVLYNATVLHIVASSQFWFVTDGLRQAAREEAERVRHAAKTAAEMAKADAERAAADSAGDQDVDNAAVAQEAPLSAVLGAAAGARAAVAAFDTHFGKDGEDGAGGAGTAAAADPVGVAASDGTSAAEAATADTAAMRDPAMSGAAAGAAAGAKSALEAYDRGGRGGEAAGAGGAAAKTAALDTAGTSGDAAANEHVGAAAGAVAGAVAGSKAALAAFDGRDGAGGATTLPPGDGADDDDSDGDEPAATATEDPIVAVTAAGAEESEGASTTTSDDASTDAGQPPPELDGVCATHQVGGVYVTFTVFCIKPSCAIYFGVVDVRLKKKQADDAAAMAVFGRELLGFVKAKCADIFCVVAGDFGDVKGGNALYRQLTAAASPAGGLQDAWLSSSMHMGKARVSFNDWRTVDDPAVAATSLPVSGMDFQDWVLYHQGNATVEVPSTAVVSHQFAPEGAASDFVLSDHFPVAAYFTLLAEERDVAEAAAAGNTGWDWGFSGLPGARGSGGRGSGDQAAAGGEQPAEVPSLSLPPLPLAARDKLPRLKHPLGVPPAAEVAAVRQEVTGMLRALTGSMDEEMGKLEAEMAAEAADDANSTTVADGGLNATADVTTVAPAAGATAE